jgi:hypothetical protein
MMLAKGAVGAMTAAAAVPAALATGASNLGSFVALANEFTKGGYKNSYQSTYYALKKQGLSDEEAADKAESVGLVGGATQLAVSGVLSGSIHTPELQAAEPAVNGLLDGIVKSAKNMLKKEAPKMAATSGGASLVESGAEAAAGVDVDPLEAMKSAVKEAGHGAVIAAAFWGLHEPLRVPSYLRPQLHNVAASVPVEAREEYLNKAVEQGVITEEQKIKVAKSINEFGETKPAVDDLPIPEEKKAAITGKLVQAKKIQEEIESLTPYGASFNDRVKKLNAAKENIHADINKMYGADDVYSVEHDSLTGESPVENVPEVLKPLTEAELNKPDGTDTKGAVTEASQESQVQNTEVVLPKGNEGTSGSNEPVASKESGNTEGAVAEAVQSTEEAKVNATEPLISPSKENDARQTNGTEPIKVNSEKVQYNGQDVIGNRSRPESDKVASRSAAKEKIKDSSTNASLKAANDYNKSVGLPEVTPHPYKPSDKEVQGKISELYPKLQDVNSPHYKETDTERNIFSDYKSRFPKIIEENNVKDYKDLVKKAYGQLMKEVNRQFDALPVKVSFHEGDKNYENSAEMLDDVHNFNHIWVFKGGDDHTELGSATRDANGLTANDKFRAVHDYFGHSVEGYQFGKDGEENAWIEHSKMFSPLAQWALSSETRGQNSFVNYSGVNEVPMEKIKLGSAMKKEGKKSGNAQMVAEGQKLLDEANAEFSYAEQKAMLLPASDTDYSNYHNTHIKETPKQLTSNTENNASVQSEVPQQEVPEQSGKQEYARTIEEQNSSKPQADGGNSDLGSEGRKTKISRTKTSSSLRNLSSKIREEGLLPHWAKADLPEGTKGAGFGGKSLDEAVAKSLELVADAIDAGKGLADSVNEGFAHVRDYYEKNAKSFDEKKLERDYKERIKKQLRSAGQLSGITHAETKATREEFGLGEPYEKTAKSDDQLRSDAVEEIKKGYNVDKLLGEAEKGKVLSDKETTILKIHKAGLEAAIEKNPTDEKLAQLRRLVKASDAAGSEQGRALRSRQGLEIRDDSLAGYFRTRAGYSRGRTFE